MIEWNQMCLDSYKYVRKGEYCIFALLLGFGVCKSISTAIAVLMVRLLAKDVLSYCHINVRR